MTTHSNRILIGAFAAATLLALFALSFAMPAAHAQQIVRGYYPPPVPEEIYLGHAHVDGPVDHDDIQVGRYAGRFHSIVLRVNNAPIQFDRVVIHYGNRTSQVLPVREAIGPGQSSRWIQLPGGERVIRSLELWYSRADPRLPLKPEVNLFGRP